MQKITRIYVGNYGINAAWYDGLTLDLTDAETQEATDALINLENGGGKTTFLSFVFSCFETPQDKFLKHLQNPNHRFGQYFSSDGRPGFILIEWEMPPKVAGGVPYRVVIGQVVSVKSRSDKTDVERIFFSFEVTATLQLESVPAPKLDGVASETLAEVSKWLHDTQRANNDFFCTRGQSDWQKHLRDERLIDVDMLQLQVFFSAQEGGIDTSFLNFKSEPEFVHKFFDLTVDATRANAVREAVVNTCDKLAKKPDTQLRLKELVNLHGSLTRFQAEANQYASAQSTRDAAYAVGEGLVVSLEHRVHTLCLAAAADQRMAEAQVNIIEVNEKRQKSLARKVDAISFVRHDRTLERTAKKANTTEKAYAEAKQKVGFLEAARAKKEVAGALAVRNELEARAALETASLLPWRQAVENHGSNLHHALGVILTQTKASQQEAERVAEDAKREVAKLEQERAQQAVRDSNLLTESTRFETLEATCSQVREHLVVDGVLFEKESTSEATVRWEEVLETNAKSVEHYKGRADEQLRARLGFQSEANLTRAEASKHRATHSQHQIFVAEGESERERLAQLEIARLAADADLADPESPALLIALERLGQASANEVAISNVRLSQLHASRNSIDETGVTGESADVSLVVARLKELGIKSARPFKEYIAHALQDAAKARALVLSNPARFLGVCVAQIEYESARTRSFESLPLVGPVLVSPTDLEPASGATDWMVVPPADDAAFNFDAAEVVLASLKSRISEESKCRDFYASQQQDATLAIARVREFFSNFGDGKIQNCIEELRGLEIEIAGLEQRAEMLDGQAEQAFELADSYRNKVVECETARTLFARHLSDIERFVKNHEVGRPARLSRIKEISDIRRELSARAAVIELRRNELLGIQDAQLGKIHSLRTEHGKLADQYANVKYFDSSSVSSEASLSKDLETLTLLYLDAAALYETEEGHRIGVMQVKLEAARTDYTQKEKQFVSRYADIPESAILPFLTETHDYWYPKISEEIEAAEHAKSSAGAWYAVALAAMKDVKTLVQLDALIVEQMRAATDDDLKIEAEVAAAEIEASSAAATQANAFLTKLQDSIRAAISERATAQMAVHGLRSSLTLPEILSAAPVPLEENFQLQVAGVGQQFRARELSVSHARAQATKMFEDVKMRARSEAFARVEPDISAHLQRNDFDAACADGERILASVSDRIGTTQWMLNGMEADFDTCIGELSNLANSAISLLVSATSKKVPATAPWVGGMPMFKMQAKFNDVQQEARKQALRNYLDSLIDTKVVPAKGAAMVADAVSRIYGRSLGIRLLKMSPDSDLQYVTVDKIQNSGGEAVVMAMFLYLLINQIRSETQAKVRRNGGGPLILDNPFAKATNPAMWKAQRELAASMDVQLIFATALPDYNAVADFPRFIHLRKAGKNTKSNRWHLEIVDFTLKSEEEPAPL